MAGIDCWLDLCDGMNSDFEDAITTLWPPEEDEDPSYGLALQIKSLKFHFTDPNPFRMVIEIDSEDSIKRLSGYLYPLLKDPYRSNDEERVEKTINNVMRSAHNLLKARNKYTNITTALVLVASPSSPHYPQIERGQELVDEYYGQDKLAIELRGIINNIQDRIIKANTLTGSAIHGSILEPTKKEVAL